MSKGKRDSNVYCPKHYGDIKFVVAGTTAYCPVSNAHDCLECDIVTKGEADRAGKEVMKAEK